MLKRTARTGRIPVSCCQDYLVGNYVPDYIVAFSTYARITVLRRNDNHKTVPLMVMLDTKIAIFKIKIVFFISFIIKKLLSIYVSKKTTIMYN